MTFGEKLRNYLAAAKANAIAGTWDANAWVRAVDEFADVERPLKKAPKKAPINLMSDDEFREFLRTEPLYAGIDIDKEIAGLRVWCEMKGKKLTRMRIITNLKKADKTLERHGRSADVRKAAVEERSLPVPAGWREFMKGKMREWQEKNGDQYDPPGAHAIARDDFFGMPTEWRAECRRVLGGDRL